jgi:hypothetical protein
MWLRTVLDDGKRNALKYFTLVRDCRLLTAKTVTRTGSYAGLHVPDPRGKHTFNEQTYDCMNAQMNERTHEEGKNECMNESIHTATSEHAYHAVGCANLCSIGACSYTCKSVIAAARVLDSCKDCQGTAGHFLLPLFSFPFVQFCCWYQ